MTEEKELSLWNEAIFVFDTSALLALYLVPQSNRTMIFNEIFEKISSRLWLPFHVQYEFLKNRETKIKEPLNRFAPIKDDIKYLQDTISNKIATKITSMMDMTKNDEFYPHIEESEFSDFNEIINDFNDKFNLFEKKIRVQIENAEGQIIDLQQNDDVLDSVEKYFHVGREFLFDEIMKITKEGRFRYDYKIPPGYGAYYSSDPKEGIQVFGDLIIWKQILELANEIQLPIIFITNDITKKDWCHSEGKNRIDTPREELIKEMKDLSGMDFWMYSFTQFIYGASAFLKASVDVNLIQNVSTYLSDTYVHSTEHESV